MTAQERINEEIKSIAVFAEESGEIEIAAILVTLLAAAKDSPIRLRQFFLLVNTFSEMHYELLYRQPR